MDDEVAARRVRDMTAMLAALRFRLDAEDGECDAAADIKELAALMETLLVLHPVDFRLLNFARTLIELNEPMVAIEQLRIILMRTSTGNQR